MARLVDVELDAGRLVSSGAAMTQYSTPGVRPRAHPGPTAGLSAMNCSSGRLQFRATLAQVSPGKACHMKAHAAACADVMSPARTAAARADLSCLETTTMLDHFWKTMCQRRSREQVEGDKCRTQSRRDAAYADQGEPQGV